MDLTCPICYGTYDNKEQIPRILQWGHTFCQRCLMDLRTSNMLACPTCRSWFSPDVNQLIKNFTILEAKDEGAKYGIEVRLLRFNDSPCLITLKLSISSLLN